jgi:hypothetical protein
MTGVREDLEEVQVASEQVHDYSCVEEGVLIIFSCRHQDQRRLVPAYCWCQIPLVLASQPCGNCTSMVGINTFIYPWISSWGGLGPLESLLRPCMVQTM